jgi:hypothetical protein
MIRFRGPFAAALWTCALVFAGSASATQRIHTTAFVLKLPSSRTASLTRTCQATLRDRHPSGPRLDVIGSPRRTAIVACEQPPRSELILPQSLKPTSSSAFDELG